MGGIPAQSWMGWSPAEVFIHQAPLLRNDFQACGNSDEKLAKFQEILGKQRSLGVGNQIEIGVMETRKGLTSQSTGKCK